jgi:hypothetical protein
MKGTIATIMVRYLVFFLSCCTLLFGSPLIDRMKYGQNGDYLVSEFNKMITLLSIRSITSDSFVLEEISIPSQSLKNHPSSWAEWVRNKAPGHTSWSMTEIDLKSGEIIECYSFSRSSWIQLSSKDSFFSHLIQLPLQPLSADKQPRIGPPPPPGELDVRKIWTPPFCFEGKKRGNPLFDAYEATWPQDGTDLSGKTVILYFDRETRFPLPFWIQIEAAYGTASMHAIDSGRKLPSPFASLPKRVPQFVGQPKKTKTGLRLSIKSPKYYRKFELFAIDVTGKDKQILPLTHSLIEGENEFLTLEIDEDQLRQTLELDHRYTWLLVPTGSTQSYTETIKPFLWSQKE